MSNGSIDKSIIAGNFETAGDFESARDFTTIEEFVDNYVRNGKFDPTMLSLLSSLPKAELEIVTKVVGDFIKSSKSSDLNQTEDWRDKLSEIISSINAYPSENGVTIRALSTIVIVMIITALYSGTVFASEILDRILPGMLDQFMTMAAVFDNWSGKTRDSVRKTVEDFVVNMKKGDGLVHSVDSKFDGVHATVGITGNSAFTIAGRNKISVNTNDLKRVKKDAEDLIKELANSLKAVSLSRNIADEAVREHRQNYIRNDASAVRNICLKIEQETGRLCAELDGLVKGLAYVTDGYIKLEHTFDKL
jgi:hypothetical protein